MFSNAYFFISPNPQIDFEHDYMTCEEAHDYAEAGWLAITTQHVFTVNY